MSVRAASPWVAVAVVAVMVLASLGLVGGLLGAAPAGHASGATPARTVSTKAVPSAATGSNLVAQNALAAAKAAGVSPRTVFVPRPSASPSQIAAASSQGYVTPLYSGAPAPMGLAEYGLKSNATGNVTPFILNTTSVRGTFSPGANGPNATDLADSSPDGYGVQLNSVATNVTLFGNNSYQFWTQNVIEYYPVIGALYLITNVWNFSSPASYLSPNVFYAHGPHGQQVGTTYYYAFVGPLTVTYPFTATFTMTSHIMDGRNAVNFSLVVANPQSGAVEVNATNYDYVVFNSLANGTAPLTQPANYTADGYHYNPLGLTNDYELTIGGPGGGSQTTFIAGGATETLDYWNATSGMYQAVPSAFSYGGETGETATGLNSAWSTAPNGQPQGDLTTGASLLGGLWNASSPGPAPGTLALNVTPSNAFELVSFAGASQSAFNSSQVELAPTITTNHLTLPAGTYRVTTEYADYVANTSMVSIGPGVVTNLNVTLARNASWGVYTPLWAWTNAQIASQSTSGNGTAGNPYVLVNNQVAMFASVFGVLNDYGFPVWPGVYFLGTTAHTEFFSPPSLEVNTSGQHAGPYAVPATNNLPYWFFDTSNIAILNATNITGWFSLYAYDYPFFLTFNVEFWNSTNMVIANDTFATESNALLLYNGMSGMNPTNFSSDALVWGNHFVQVAPPAPNGGLVPFALGLGLSEQESGDLIFNNYFATPTTAVSIPQDLYFGTLVFYQDTWNVTPQPANTTFTSPTWPTLSFSGSILRTAKVGGNFWWDYGLANSPYTFDLGNRPNSNPYNVLPYTESGWIVQSSGDFAPLLNYSLYSVTFASTGLFAGAYWQFSVNGTGAHAATFQYQDVLGNPPAMTVTLPNGTYTVNASSSGYGTLVFQFRVNGTATTVNLTFTSTETFQVSFEAVGLPANVTWAVVFDGKLTATGAQWINFTGYAPGDYTYYTQVLNSSYRTSPSSGTVALSSNRTIRVQIRPYAPTFTVYFTESGLAAGTTWNVIFDSINFSAATSTIAFTGVAPGLYAYTVGGVANYTVSPSGGGVTVTSSDVSLGVLYTPITYSVTFTETGLPANTAWAVAFGGVILGTTGTSITFLVGPGTYTYFIGVVVGYTPSASTGAVTVVSSPQTVPITFT